MTMAAVTAKFVKLRCVGRVAEWVDAQMGKSATLKPRFVLHPAQPVRPVQTASSVGHQAPALIACKI